AAAAHAVSVGLLLHARAAAARAVDVAGRVAAVAHAREARAARAVLARAADLAGPAAHAHRRAAHALAHLADRAGGVVAQRARAAADRGDTLEAAVAGLETRRGQTARLTIGR